MNEAAEESRDNVLINQVVCDDNTKLEEGYYLELPGREREWLERLE